jgi:hypothetical protein
MGEKRSDPRTDWRPQLQPRDYLQRAACIPARYSDTCLLRKWSFSLPGVVLCVCGQSADVRGKCDIAGAPFAVQVLDPSDDIHILYI